MQYQLVDKPDFAVIQVRFDQPGEQLIAESGAMVARDAGIEMKSSIQGGLGGALKRKMLGGESLFQNTFTATQAGQSIWLAPAPEGAVERGSMHNVLGNVLLDQGQREPAVEEFVAANREDPEMSEAMFSAGYTLADVPERRQQAILYLQRFIAARGGNAPREYLDIAQNRLAQLQSPGAH